ncbi:MAG: TIGR01777 family protein [Deltaproteobacteria bacterium]|nr:TIGR01777 family protein [Deltaproteobacteria bacterium]
MSAAQGGTGSAKIVQNRKNRLKNRAEFIRKAEIAAPIEEVFAWHARPGAISRLSPPWDPLRLISVTNGIHPGSRVAMELRAGPIPFIWEALHTRYEKNVFFEDIQVRGPFSSWTHVHSFEKSDLGNTILEDRISYTLPFHPVGASLLNGFVQKKLARIFAFRHFTTNADILFHRLLAMKTPSRFLLSGASGMIGSNLIPFLTTAGHKVSCLVRRKPEPEKNEIFWDPISGKIDADKLEGFDAVIHLCGENIGQGRWTREKKNRIISSRTLTTGLLAQTLAGLKNPPEVFISASAIGFYGDRGDKILTEEDGFGNDFISDVCRQWEASATSAINAGIRTVFPRIGVVLHPSGGALKKMLPLFSKGLGGKIGNGRQHMSWVSMDDVVCAIMHMASTPEISGPVNLVSPEPATNAVFSRTLSEALRRCRGPAVPGSIIIALFGEMGKETVLSSSRVMPSILLKTGYKFRHPELRQAVCHVLGKE